MALVRSRPGAYAQAETGGVPPSLLRIALLKSDAMKMAAQRTYGRQIEQGREGLSLSGMIFDKQMDQRQQIAEKNLSLRRHMFNRDMQMQNERFAQSGNREPFLPDSARKSLVKQANRAG